MATSETTAAAAQAAALRDGAGVRTRADLVEVSVTGDDARSWLNGQVTNDVRQTKAAQSVYALVVSVKGKIMAELWMLDRGESLSILLPRGTVDEVLERFESQIIMEDVELEKLDDSGLLSVQGPLAESLVRNADTGAEAFPFDELGVGGVLLRSTREALPGLQAKLLAAAAAGPVAVVDDAGFDLCRLRLGRPRFGSDFDASNYPQEAGLKERAVSFNKGCYLGQEVICTLESRGKLSRGLHALEADAAVEAGAEICSEDGAVVGRITSGVVDPESGRWLGMGYLKRVAHEAGAALSAGEAVLSKRG